MKQGVAGKTYFVKDAYGFFCPKHRALTPEAAARVFLRLRVKLE